MPLVFRKSPKRPDHRVVVRLFDRDSQFSRNLMRSMFCKASPKLFCGPRPAVQRVAHGGQLRGVVQSPAVQIRSRHVEPELAEVRNVINEFLMKLTA